jgi:hypothetical protein
MLSIVVCGSSPVAHSIAAMASLAGHGVTVLTREPYAWDPDWRLRVRLPGGGRCVVRLRRVTEDANIVRGADMVLVCVPHTTLQNTLEWIAPYVPPRGLVGGIPGFGGFGLLARGLLPSQVVFGTQRIPFVVRRFSPGHAVQIGGIRRQTFVGSIPANAARRIAELLSLTLAVPTVPVSHYLNVELSPSNSIVHPARLYTALGQGSIACKPEAVEFYRHWDYAASEQLLALSNELQYGRTMLPRDTSFVTPILAQYDACDAAMLTDRIRNLHALWGRALPLKRDAPGRLPAFDSDYFLEDVNVGLRLIRSILRMAGAAAPCMDEILSWWDWQACEQARTPTAQDWRMRCFTDIEELARWLD